MIFLDILMLSCLVVLWAAWQHPGMCREVVGLNLRISPLGEYVTIAQSFAVASFHSLTCLFFPPKPALFCPLSRGLSCCFAVLFLSALIFTGPEICFYFIKAANWAFFRDHLFPTVVCSDIVLGPVYKLHMQHWFKFTCTVDGRKGKNKRMHNSCFFIITNNRMIFPFRESSFYFNILVCVVNARKHFTTLDAPSIS